MEPDFIDYANWLQEGIDKGYCTPRFCYTHEGDPFMDAEEEEQWEAGGDPCMPVTKFLVY